MDMNHILIVEDDKDIREGVAIYLKSQGWDIRFSWQEMAWKG